MPEASSYGLFVVAALAILLIPGPAVFYVVTRSIDGGRRAGVVSALGLGIGNLFHVVAAVAGLSALLASSAIAFSVVKYAGAAYLIYIGVRRLLTKVDDAEMSTRHHDTRRLFIDGVVINVLNPKIAVFFLAFLPQFVDPTSGSATLQIAVLGVTLVLIGVVTDSLYGILAGTMGSWLRGRGGWRATQRYVSGTIFIALGVGSAIAAPSKR